MLGWLRRWFGSRTAAQAGRDNPVLKRSVEKSSAIFNRTPLRKILSRKVQNAMSREVFLEINSICNAADPFLTCRERLAGHMMKFAAFQVLMIPEEPEDDVSGLRGQPGVTGELGKLTQQIVETNFELRSEFGDPSKPVTEETARSFVERRYWQQYWFLETVNAVRVELKDFPEQGDWYLPFKHAACATMEAIYRRELDLPSAFEQDVASAANIAYPLFTDIVIAGDENPDEEWRDYHKDRNVPYPFFLSGGYNEKTHYQSG